MQCFQCIKDKKLLFLIRCVCLSVVPVLFLNTLLLWPLQHKSLLLFKSELNVSLSYNINVCAWELFHTQRVSHLACVAILKEGDKYLSYLEGKPCNGDKAHQSQRPGFFHSCIKAFAIVTVVLHGVHTFYLTAGCWHRTLYIGFSHK